MATLFIDIGSNSIKALLARFECGRVARIAEYTQNSRISSAGGLKPDAADIIFDCANELSALAKNDCASFGAFCFGTSALRDSPTANGVLKSLGGRGLKIRVLSGQEEAILSFEGAMLDENLNISPSEPIVYADLGGGSMEFVVRQNGKISMIKSLPIGAVRLTNSFAQNSSLDRAGLRLHCAQMMSQIPVPRGNFRLVVAGGAVSAARFILGGGKMSEKRELSLRDFEDALSIADSFGAEGLEKKFGTPKNRADILPAAFLCLIETIRHFGAGCLEHTQFSLRYGVAAAYFAGRLNY